MSDQVLAGTVARIIRNRGFGFLTGSDGVERFFHSSSVRPWVNFDNLAEGDPITFQEDRSPKGPRAKNIDLGDPSERRPRNDSTQETVAPVKTGARVGRMDMAPKTKAEGRARQNRASQARGFRTR